MGASVSFNLLTNQGFELVALDVKAKADTINSSAEADLTPEDILAIESGFSDLIENFSPDDAEQFYTALHFYGKGELSRYVFTPKSEEEKIRICERLNLNSEAA